MYGAILGDIIGSPYEFDMGDKTKNFPLFNGDSYYTDDTVMTVAVAKAFLKDPDADRETIENELIKQMRHYGRLYPNAGYGGMFYRWLFGGVSEPYNSLGNGSAMRCSVTGWLYDSLEKTLEAAKWSAEVTHNHPEGIKGAQATAAAIYLARNHASKREIREYIENTFHYDLSRTLDEIRPGYHHDETCMRSVPEAITAFLESADFEDAVRNAVSLGGDADTVACICGSIAEAYYGVPEELKKECRRRIPKGFCNVLDLLEETINTRK